MKNKLFKWMALVSLMALVATMMASCVTGSTYADETGKDTLSVSSKEEVIEVPYTGKPKVTIVQEYRN